jgi:outer membrane biosynthesis protein TonB
MHADSERMDIALLDVKGVGPSTAQLLVEAGFTNVASLASARSKALEAVRGVGPARAISLRAEAQQLLAGSEPAPAAVTGGEAPRRVEKASSTKKTKKTKPTKKTRKASSTKKTKKAKPAKRTKPTKKKKSTKKAKKAKS